MATLLRAIHRFNAGPLKILLTTATRHKNNPKFHMEVQRFWISRAILRKKSNAVASPHLSSRYTRELGNKAPGLVEWNRWPRNKSPQFVNYMMCAKTSIEKRQLSSQDSVRKIGYPCVKDETTYTHLFHQKAIQNISKLQCKIKNFET